MVALGLDLFIYLNLQIMKKNIIRIIKSIRVSTADVTKLMMLSAVFSLQESLRKYDVMLLMRAKIREIVTKVMNIIWMFFCFLLSRIMTSSFRDQSSLLQFRQQILRILITKMSKERFCKFEMNKKVIQKPFDTSWVLYWSVYSKGNRLSSINTIPFIIRMAHPYLSKQ